MALVDENLARIEGYLKKYTNLISRWKTRYFILENGILSYYSEKGGSLRGTIHMSISEVIQSPGGKNIF
jgi:oxysterol-binding protein 1